MNKTVPWSLAFVLLFHGAPLAGEFNFENTREGIERSLLKPAKTRLLGATTAKGRTVTVVRRKEGGGGLETVTVPDHRTGGYVNLEIQFSVNSYAIRSDSLPLLDELGWALTSPALRGRTLSVNGHTDSDGSDQHNLQLSMKRARAVKQYLVVNHAISGDRLKVTGYGEGMPLVANTSKANKQLNRRVEIVAAN